MRQKCFMPMDVFICPVDYYWEVELIFSLNSWVYWECIKVQQTVFASLRSKRSHTERTKFEPRKVHFHIRAARKWSESKEVEGRGWERRKKGTLLPANVSILKNAHQFSRLSSFIDWQLCHQALNTRLEGNKSNVCLKTSFSYGLTLTIPLLDGHFILLLLKKM